MTACRTSLLFTAPRQVSWREETLPAPGPGEVLVQSLLSAISPGSELLVYRGQFPRHVPVDESIPALSGEFAYPLKYGYSVVGRIVALGPLIDPSWQERLVFAFNPHETHFLAQPEQLQPLPPDVPAEDAVFLPNMESAVNFVMDGAPLIGEKVLVCGQGIVGLLTAALLSQFPMGRLVTLDRFPKRRQASLELGAHASLDPAAPSLLQELRAELQGEADLAFELSGAPEALDLAIQAAAFGGRIVIGSWYGEKRASLDLGGHFHRSRLRLVSSQVSSLAPELSGRWNKARRFETAWEMLRKLRPSRWITQRFPFQEADQAYRLIDEAPAQTIQVVLSY